MTNRSVTRRQLLATGGAASLLLLAPEVLRGAPALAGTPSLSMGFVDTLDPLVPGARVTPATKVANDSSLTNALLKITVGAIHPSTDAAFPVAWLDALFAQGGKRVPFYAVAHPGGVATSGATFVQVPGPTGLRFMLASGGTSLGGGLGAGQENRLRTGTYLFGLVPRTWVSTTTLANTTAQRSLVVVIRPA